MCPGKIEESWPSLHTLQSQRREAGLFKNNEQLSPEYSPLLKVKLVFVWEKLDLTQSTGCVNADVYPWGLLGSLCVRDGDGADWQPLPGVTAKGQ